MRRKSTLEDVCLFSWKMAYPLKMRGKKELQKSKYFLKYDFLDGLLRNELDKKIHISESHIGNSFEFKLDPNKEKQNYLIVQLPKHDDDKIFNLIRRTIIRVPTLEEMRKGKEYDITTEEYGSFELTEAIEKTTSILNEWYSVTLNK